MSLTKFDKKLELYRQFGDRSEAPREMDGAAVYVNDTLELAWASAQTVFGEAARPEHAIAIYEAMNRERLRRVELLPE